MRRRARRASAGPDRSRAPPGCPGTDPGARPASRAAGPRVELGEGPMTQLDDPSGDLGRALRGSDASRSNRLERVALVRGPGRLGDDVGGSGSCVPIVGEDSGRRSSRHAAIRARRADSPVPGSIGGPPADPAAPRSRRGVHRPWSTCTTAAAAAGARRAEQLVSDGRRSRRSGCSPTPTGRAPTRGGDRLRRPPAPGLRPIGPPAAELPEPVAHHRDLPGPLPGHEGRRAGPGGRARRDVPPRLRPRPGADPTRSRGAARRGHRPRARRLRRR